MGSYVEHQVLGATFETTSRYVDLVPIGIGGFSIVCSAYDQYTRSPIAIKKIAHPFQSDIFAKRTCRELMLLKHFRHENLVHLLDAYVSPGESIYVVTHLMDTDLHRLIAGNPLEPRYAQYFFYQIMRGLKYIHSAGVIHRDLKPSNVLIDQNCDVRLCDFGLSRSEAPEMTGYVSTRYYRAPEIMMSWQKYDSKIDIWSAGCILAEMVLGKPFFPGKDHINQFCLIMRFLGSPPDHLLDDNCTQSAFHYIKSLPRQEPRSFHKCFRDCDKECVDMLTKTICFDPKQRLTASEALSHPFVSTYHDPFDEPEAEAIAETPKSHKHTTVDSWKLKLFSDILDFHSRIQHSTP